jgi:hypothetical protein
MSQFFIQKQIRLECLDYLLPKFVYLNHMQQQVTHEKSLYFTFQRFVSLNTFIIWINVRFFNSILKVEQTNMPSFKCLLYV